MLWCEMQVYEMLDAGCRMCDVLLTVQYGQCVVLVPGGGAGRERVESGQPMVTASLHAPLELQMNIREVSQCQDESPIRTLSLFRKEHNRQVASRINAYPNVRQL